MFEKWRRRRDEQRSIPSGGPVWPTGSWAPFAPAEPSGALAIADVGACVKVLADAAASVPRIAYRRSEDGLERMSGGRLAALLERPAPATTQANLIAQAVAHLTLYGNAYLGKFRDENGVLEQIACLNPDAALAASPASSVA